jgi:hypothetical protein
MFRTRSSKIAVAVVVALAIGGGAYAFTASNTVPTSTAGAGTGAVSGYTVTNLHYTLDATTPANIDSLTFTISPGRTEHGNRQSGDLCCVEHGRSDDLYLHHRLTGANVTCARPPALS